MVLLLLLLLLFQGREPVAGVGGGIPFFNQEFFLFEFVRLQLRLLPFPHLLLLFTGEEEFGVFFQPVPFCEGDGFLLIGFLDSSILRGYGFLDCSDFFFCQDVDAFQLPVLVFVFRPSFLGGGIYFGTYFGVDTCTGQLFQNIRFFAFLALQERTLNEAKENEKALNAKVEACQKQYVLLQTAFDSKKTSYDDIRTLYDKQKEAVEEWAKETRSRLVVGDTCPVCGQEIKSLCKDEDFQSVLAPIRTSLETKEKEYKEAEQALNNNRTESKTYGTLAENARQSTARALRSYNLARTDAQAKCAQCNGIGLSTTTGETLKKLLEENKLEADKLNEKLTEVQKLSAQIITLQRQKDECQKHVDAARQAFNSADRVLNELKNNIVNYESLTANEKENIRATMDRVTPHILWEGWNTEWENSPLSFIDRLTQATRNYRLAQEKQRELKSAIALIHKELEGININKESIDAAFPDWRNAPAATQEMEIKDLGIAWNNLNTQASGLKQSISSTADQMARLQKDLTGFYAANPTLDEERITVLSAWSGSRIEALRASLQLVFLPLSHSFC
jgi:DNA repair protein SbcC/Rad50